MPNIAGVLKAEITRVARKEIRSETDSLQKAIAQYRRDLGTLKRQVVALEKLVRALGGKPPTTKSSAEGACDATTVARRFSPSRLAAHRKRLDLSADAFGSLIGVSGQTIYKWETGKARPRARQLEAIATVRTLGQREARALLDKTGTAE